MKKPIYGKYPQGQRLERISKSPNFKKGRFQNLSHTPALTEGYNYFQVLFQFFSNREKHRRPVDPIPSVKTNLHELPANDNLLVWFGHSSYYFQIDGKKILVDPVFSGNASPLRGTNKAFPGSDIYSADDIPQIDILFITHDHYDHLDYHSVVELKKKVKKVFCGLGVGAHLEYWGYDPDLITELDWNDSEEYQDFIIRSVPARHFSGRSLSRNKTLWTSFILKSKALQIFIGGDSGYDTHFKQIGDRFGPFDLAILEAGQYDIKWRYIHLLPEELLNAADDLKAKAVFPVHNSKFVMANHAWNEPMRKIAEIISGEMALVTPMIGIPVDLNNLSGNFAHWWEKIK